MEDDVIEPNKWNFKITKNRDGKAKIFYTWDSILSDDNADEYNDWKSVSSQKNYTWEDDDDYPSYPTNKEDALKEGWDYVERKELELKKKHDKLEKKEAALKAKEEALKEEVKKMEEQKKELEDLIRKLETKQDAQDKKDFEQNSPLADLIG